MISVSKVKITTDLCISKAYLTVLPSKHGEEILNDLNEIKYKIKHELAQRTKNQLRRMPDLTFYVDDSLEYIDQIEKSMKGEDNPISKPDLLDKRKKS